MKKIILEKVDCGINGETVHLDYKEQLLGIIVNPADGMNLAEMRSIEKVYDKLDRAECPGSILLEDAEHLTLKGILEQTKFRLFSKEIKQMVESIVAPEHVDIDLVKGVR